MFPILFRTRFGFIMTFTAVWLAGLLIAGWLIRRQKPNFSGWDGLITAGLCAVLLGRLQFVWQNAEWFGENLAERWNLFQGGHGYAGEVAGGLICLCVWGIVTKNAVRPTLALLTPILPLLYFVGWLACWFDGCGYGGTAFIGWTTAELPDNFGLMAVRYQTQLAGIAVAVFLGGWHFARRKQSPVTDHRLPTTKFWLYLALLSAARSAITLWQGNSVPLFGQLRGDLVLSAIVACAAALIAVGEIIYSNRQSGA